MFNRAKFFVDFKKAFDPELEQGQVDGINFLLSQFESFLNWTDLRHVAYAFATIYHETAGTFQPVIEAYWMSEKWRKENLRYYPYYGRGYVQLTWKKNYEKFGKLLNLDLVGKPALAVEPETSFKILSVGMQQGLFTGKKLSDFIHGSTCDYRNARTIINGLDKASLIAGYARHFEQILISAAASANSSTTDKSENSDTSTDPLVGSTTEGPPNNIKAEITPEGGVKVETTQPTGPKERIAVVKTKPKTWTQAIVAKITAAVTGNAFFQWLWAQQDKVTGLSLPDLVWVIVSLTIAIGFLLWIVYEIIATYRWNKYQENVDALLVKENSTVDNLVQIIPADEVELYRARGFKIITRGEPIGDQK